jgi:hypothetical protein
MTKAELIALLVLEVKISTLTNPDFENACNDAGRETGWGYPVTSDFRIQWTKERAKRHLFFYLMSQSAHKFKVKQVSLNQRFDHYLKIIEYMDKQFEAVVNERPDEFANVDTYKLFGTKIDAGFAYDPIGRDITYDSDQEVIFSK